MSRIYLAIVINAVFNYLYLFWTLFSHSLIDYVGWPDTGHTKDIQRYFDPSKWKKHVIIKMQQLGLRSCTYILFLVTAKIRSGDFWWALLGDCCRYRKKKDLSAARLANQTLSVPDYSFASTACFIYYRKDKATIGSTQCMSVALCVCA